MSDSETIFRKRVATSRGELEWEILSPVLITTRMSGMLDLALAKQFVGCVDGWKGLGGTGLFAFHDWSGVHDYESEARLLLTPWSKGHRARFSGIHLLVGSTALAMGIKIFNSVTGNVITSHSQRASFHAALDRARSRAR